MGRAVCLLGMISFMTMHAASAEPDGPNASGLTVRVLSFNIRYGTARDGEHAWPFRRSLVFDVIRSGQYDFVGLQEALRFQLDEINREVPGYSEIGVGRDDGKSAGEHSTILFRSQRWAVDQAGTFWLSDTPNVPGSRSWGNRIPRIVTWARFIEKTSGQALFVFNTHFDHQSLPSRVRSARLLAARIAARNPRDPVIVTGDFNAVPEEETIRYLVGSEGQTPVRLIDTYRAVHPNPTPDEATFHGFRGLTRGRRIDYVFVTEGIAVRSARIVRTSRDGRYPSDHYPVEAVLQVGGGR